MAYSDKVLDHYKNPRNVGSLPKDDPNVGTGLVGAPECGDVMKLQMRINPQTEVIEDAKFKTFGCGSAIASSSLATERVKGKPVDEALQIKNVEIVKELNLPPGKIHCSALAEDAIKAALADYRKKRAPAQRTAGAPRVPIEAPARQGPAPVHRGPAPGGAGRRLLGAELRRAFRQPARHPGQGLRIRGRAGLRRPPAPQSTTRA